MKLNWFHIGYKINQSFLTRNSILSYDRIENLNILAVEILLQLGMAENILIGIFVYLKASVEGMSLLTVPTNSNSTVYTENILLTRSKVKVFITVARPTAHKSSNPISIPFLWWKILPHLQNQSISHKMKSRKHTTTKHSSTIKDQNSKLS